MVLDTEARIDLESDFSVKCNSYVLKPALSLLISQIYFDFSVLFLLFGFVTLCTKL